MSKKELNKNDKIMKEYTLNKVGLTLQAIFVLFTLIFGIATIFKSEVKVIFEILMGITLSIMAYNNIRIYKRTLFTIPYILGAIISFFAALEILLGI